MLKRIAIAVVAVALIGATDAAAHKEKVRYPTTITFDLFQCLENCVTKGPAFPYVVAGGDIDSENADYCVSGREVLVRNAGSIEGFGEFDLTSDSGAWSGRFPIPSDAVHLEAKVLSKRINRHIVCRAATADYFLDT